MLPKYELKPDDTITLESGERLHRIRALRAIGTHAATGELGGYIESEINLSHEDNAWIYENAQVFGDARVYGDALLGKQADLVWFTHVGRENGTLTIFKAEGGTARATRGCFSGTLAEFLAAVNKTHADSKIGREYRLLIEVACSRLGVDMPESHPHPVREVA